MVFEASPFVPLRSLMYQEERLSLVKFAAGQIEVLPLSKYLL